MTPITFFQPALGLSWDNGLVNRRGKKNENGLYAMYAFYIRDFHKELAWKNLIISIQVSIQIFDESNTTNYFFLIYLKKIIFFL